MDAVGDVFGVLRGGCIEGRQRKVASLRAGTPSGDTTRAAGDGVIAAGSAV